MAPFFRLSGISPINYFVHQQILITSHDDFTYQFWIPIWNPCTLGVLDLWVSAALVSALWVSGSQGFLALWNYYFVDNELIN